MHCIVKKPFLDIFSISIPLFFFPCSIAFDMTDAIQKQFNMECDIEGNEFSVKKSINGISIAVKCTIGKVLSSCFFIPFLALLGLKMRWRRSEIFILFIYNKYF